MPFTNAVGNGGLLTTVGDLLRWNAFLGAPEGTPDGAPGLPGGRALVAALETPGRLASGRVLPYALGLDLGTVGDVRMVSHGGSTAGYKTWLARVPARGLSVAVLCNHDGADASALGARIVARALAAPGPEARAVRADAPVAPAAGLAADVARYAGVFWSARTGVVVRTAVVDGRLARATGDDGGPHARRPAPLPPPGRAGGRVPRVRARGRPRARAPGRRRGGHRAPGAGAAARHGGGARRVRGTYRSAELDLRITVALRDGALLWLQPFGVERPLQAVFAGGFTTPLRGRTTVVFTRDGAGRVDGLGMWAAGVRDLRFVRE
jgi:hypothetical protein